MVWQKCSGIRRSYLCKFIHKMNCIQKNIEKITEWNIIFKAHVDESVQLILSDIHFVDWPEITQIICYTFFLRGDCDEQT